MPSGPTGKKGPIRSFKVAWEAMTPQEQAAYREERRTAGTVRWRERHPDQALIRDALLVELDPEACCDMCGSLQVRLWVTDYETRAYIWRCVPCAMVARAAWRQSMTIPPSTQVHGVVGPSTNNGIDVLATEGESQP